MSEPQPEKALAMLAQQHFNPSASKIAWLNANTTCADFFNQPALKYKMDCEQCLRPEFLQLKNAGYNVHPQLAKPEKLYDMCMIITGKSREENELYISRAKAITREYGLILIGGAKNTGIGSLRKRLSKNAELIDSLSKYHSMAFACHNTENQSNEPAPLRSLITNGQTYQTSPGLFSAKKIDTGSALLAGHFDENTKGSVADLGAGWGYLSGEAMRNSDAITKLDLYEADWRAVEISKSNLASHATNITINFHWHDVSAEPISLKYDHVIMNPPFHSGKKTAVDLGRKFIETASKILKPGGRLLMVANRQLAYEQIVAQSFGANNILQETDGFKIISAFR